MVLLWGSAVLSAIVDNIPYVATMSPVVAELVDGRRRPGPAQVLWWSLALGADLGGNATADRRLGQRRRAGHRRDAPGNRSRFWEFTKYGLVVTVITVALAVPYLWLRYFVFA